MKNSISYRYRQPAKEGKVDVYEQCAPSQQITRWQYVAARYRKKGKDIKTTKKNMRRRQEEEKKKKKKVERGLSIG